MTAATEVLTLAEAAALLRCSPDTVRRRAMAGELPGRSGLGGWRFSRQALLNWLASGDDRETVAWRSTCAAKSGGLESLSEISERCEKALATGKPRSAQRAERNRLSAEEDKRQQALNVEKAKVRAAEEQAAAQRATAAAIWATGRRY